jgi:drug/metabolite transporter superfamily protein YnfA
VAVARSLALFAVAALFEIGGAWLVWQGLREHRGLTWIGAGFVALSLYGLVATFQPSADFGRILAAYGGILAAYGGILAAYGGIFVAGSLLLTTVIAGWLMLAVILLARLSPSAAGVRYCLHASGWGQEMPKPLRMVCASTVSERTATAATLMVATILKARPFTASPRTLARLARTRT